MPQSETTNRHPALFLDRDGVINHEVGYLSSPQHLRYVDGIVPLLRSARSLRYRIIVITNQSGIGRGLYTEADFHTLMAHIRADLKALDAAFDAVYFCPDHPVHGVGVYQRESSLRKPAPGMLLQAAEEHHLDLSRSILVGDRCSDIAAGHAAGLPHLFLLAGTEPAPCPGEYTPIASLDVITTFLRDASDFSGSLT